MSPLALILLIDAVIVVIVGLAFALRGRPAGQDLVDERIGRTERKKRKGKDKDEQVGAVIGAAVDRAVAGRGFAQNLSTQLARADVQITVGEFLTLTALVVVGLVLLFYLLNRAVLIPVGAVLGFFGPRWYISNRQGQRLKLFNEQIGDALNLMVNSLRAGYSTLQAMEVISKEMPQPIAKEFGRVVLEMQLGIAFDDAMANLLRRMPSGDLDLVITAMSVQREVGGNLAEVLDAISFTIRERVRIKGEIKVLTAQGRITGYVITGIPFALAGFIYLYNPGFMGLMFEDICGWAMIAVSFVMIGLGYFFINKIISIEV